MSSFIFKEGTNGIRKIDIEYLYVFCPKLRREIAVDVRVVYLQNSKKPEVAGISHCNGYNYTSCKHECDAVDIVVKKYRELYN